MPKRPRSHRVADQSRIAFERALPPQWVFRLQNPDYGIDGEVEIFDEDGHSTGLRFYVQLKATDGTDDHARSVRITTDNSLYYQALELPVLVVSYHAPSVTLYARWFQEINPRDAGEAGATISVTFNERHRWNDGTPRSLVRAVRIRRTLRSKTTGAPIPVRIEAEPIDARPVLLNELPIALGSLASVVELTADVELAQLRPEVRLLAKHFSEKYIGCSRSNVLKTSFPSTPNECARFVAE